MFSRVYVTNVYKPENLKWDDRYPFTPFVFRKVRLVGTSILIWFHHMSMVLRNSQGTHKTPNKF